MNENEKLILAELYIRKMAEGINPLTNEVIEDTNFINNVKISRCLYYVSDVLRQVADGGNKKENKSGDSQFYITDEQRHDLVPFDRYVFSRDIAERINEATIENNCKKFSARWILEYLLSIGMMEIVNGRKVPTEEGEEFGIKSEIRTDTNNRTYKVNRLSPDAQRFIFDNIDAILYFVISDQYKEQIRRNRITQTDSDYD